MEIETTQVDTEKTVLFAEKETELLNSRQNQERRVVKLIQDDQSDQIRALEEQLTVAKPPRPNRKILRHGYARYISTHARN